MICNYYSKVKTEKVFNQKLIEKIIGLTVKELGIKKDLAITVLLVGDKKIKDLNKTYRQKDKITDVLSFSAREGQKMVLPESDNYLGEIFICYPQAKRQARKFGHSLKKEISFLLIHGFLHLLGYDDQKVKDYAVMKKVQDKIFLKIYDKV